MSDTQFRMGKIKCYYCVRLSNHISGKFKYCVDLKVGTFINGGLTGMACHTNNTDEELEKMKANVRKELGFSDVELIRVDEKDFKW